jgi:hypothetical protein
MELQMIMKTFLVNGDIEKREIDKIEFTPEKGKTLTFGYTMRIDNNIDVLYISEQNPMELCPVNLKVTK